jgi:hypothetical protein
MLWRRKRKRKTRVPSHERRREPRSEDFNQVTLEPRGELPPGLGKGVYYAQSRDASPSGLKVETDVEFPAGTKVLIKLKSPKTSKLIQATATVIWVQTLREGRGYRTGLEFTEMSLEAIMNFLEHIYRA